MVPAGHCKIILEWSVAYLLSPRDGMTTFEAAWDQEAPWTIKSMCRADWSLEENVCTAHCRSPWHRAIPPIAPSQHSDHEIQGKSWGLLIRINTHSKVRRRFIVTEGVFCLIWQVGETSLGRRIEPPSGGEGRTSHVRSRGILAHSWIQGHSTMNL